MSEHLEDYETKELSPRERVVAVIKEQKVFLLLCGAAVTVMGYFAFHHTPVEASASHLAPAPSMSQTVGSAKPTPSYADSISRDSRQRTEQAQHSGVSSMTTVMPDSTQSGLPTKLDDGSADEQGDTAAAGNSPPDLPSAQDTPPAPPKPKPVEAVKVTTPPRHIAPAHVVHPLNQDHVQSDRSMLEHLAQLGDFRPSYIQVASAETATTTAGRGGSTSASSRSSGAQGIGGATGSAGGVGAGGGLSSAGSADALAAAQDSDSTQFPLPDPGTVLAGHILGLVDNSSPGTVLATMDQGPYAGARMLGSFTEEKNGLLLRFNGMTITYTDEDGDKRSKYLAINAVAVNSDTLGTNMVSYINHHVLERVGISLATGFAQGLGQAIEQSGSTATMSATGGSFISEGKKNTMQQMLQATGTAFSGAGSILQSIYGNMGTTIKVFQNTPCAFLFLPATSGQAGASDTAGETSKSTARGAQGAERNTSSVTDPDVSQFTQQTQSR